MSNIHLISEQNSLVTEWMNEISNVHSQNHRMTFRRNLERIGEIAAYEISKKLEYKTIQIQTPLAQKDSYALETQPIVMTILRAGVPLFNGVMNYFDKADAGFIAAYRKENGEDISVQQDYVTCPDINGRPLILADPMLATSSSLVKALEEILAYGQPSVLHVVCAIASEQGVAKFSKHFPNAHLWCGSIDPRLNDRNYIVPGLGDAGDLSYGSKLQN
ncbi:uracil phosphoribosyltransferase [Candidatus Ornithobacterium hominis]|uniref:uracil phosphoribosyltransferase n=1 Tax=Candidatus Ornithobacterium hominis TaxID=2497989 RepID=UPI0024BC600E|nr:uracil phosphoribosyltransferase [Candidatus Ornithobacterium hominis]CAI9429982.1 uracil phosphoribosyltransferase [Candidatus Ornithobacterium hominis]